MKLKLTWLMTLFMAFVMQFSYAQEKTVTGTVTSSSDGLPLPGVNVIVKGTTRGTQSDFDGKYTIRTSANETLVFSFVGLKTEERNVGANSTINVQLAEDASALEEVVIIGYGTTTKEAFTGSAAVVDVADLEMKTVSNISQALKGEVSGVTVVQGSGAPGRDATIRIRGFGSVNGNRDPLYVVDGAPFASDISAINPADIESMTILKDAAATSIYGSRGANGVILITTKKGKEGKTRISVDFKTSINTQMLPNYDVITSPEEYIELSWLSLKNKGTLLGQPDPAAWASANLYGASPEAINQAYNIWDAPGDQLIDPVTGKFNNGINRRWTPTKWADAAFGNAIRTEANVQFNGGNEKTKFNTSFGYLDDNGYDVNSRFTRYTTRINVENKATDWLTVGGNIAYTGSRYNNATDINGTTSSGNIFAVTNTTPAIYDIYLRDLDGNLVEDPIFGGFQYDYGGDYGRRAWNATNGVADAMYDLNLSDVSTLLGNFNVTVDITDWLAFETRYSGQFETTQSVSRGNPYYGAVAPDGGSLFKNVDTRTNQNFLKLLRFTKTFGDHNVEAFVAHESTENVFKRISAGALRAILPNSLDLSQYTIPFGRANSFTQSWSIESYFGQLNYNYDRKYYLTGSIRRDGSSRFFKNKWGTFGSVGAGWVVSNEDFFSNVNFMDYLKLKASYGIIADQGVSLQYGWQLFSINNTVDGSYSFTQSSLQANPDLTWETSKILQVGFETEFFDGKLALNVDYYDKRTDNLFFNENLPGSTGFQQIQYNDGQLQNAGLEFDIQAQLIQKEDFRLSIGFNGEMINNEITKMPTPLSADSPLIFDDAANLAKGKSIYDWYMREWAGVDPGSGAALWYQYYDDVNDNGIFDAGDVSGTFYVDLDGDGGLSDNSTSTLYEYKKLVPGANIRRTTTSVFANATQKFIGKTAIPKLRGGFRINTGFKNFDLSAQFSYSLGGHVYDFGYAALMDNDLIGSNNWHTDIRGSWQQPGDITNVPRMSSGYGPDSNTNATSTRFLTKADFLSLNNLQLGYSIPERFISNMNLSKLNLYVSGDNLLMFSARKGLNPSTLFSQSNYGTFMPMTTFSLGAKIEF